MAAVADHRQPTGATSQGHPARRSSGRRKAKGCDSSGQKKVKQPQRGMGVEKLERLRVKEDLKKMAEAAPFPDPAQKMDGFGAPAHGAYLGFQYGPVDLFGKSPNAVKCYSGHCNSCHKKKKYNGGECGFLGLNNIGEYQKMGMVPSVGNIGKQVVAVHRRGGGSSSSGEGGVMMEYEFFPVSCKADSDADQGFVVMNMSSSSSGFDDHVDLSLKL